MSDTLKDKLKSRASKQAFERALGKAIDVYSNNARRILLARSLLEKNGLLCDEDVRNEISKILLFGSRPNMELIGQRWKKYAEAPLIDFTGEVDFLLKALENELKNTDAFQAVFEFKSLDSINTNTTISIDELANINSKLQAMLSMHREYLSKLTEALASSSNDISKLIIDNSHYIIEKTHDFVGRKWVIDKVDRFIASNDQRYFFIKGQPGIGKTAIAAQLVKERGYIHHFNIRSANINKTEYFYRNVCAQFIAEFKLDYKTLPDKATEDATFLTTTLLNEVTQKESLPTIILVDALDEVDYRERSAGVNVLYLPDTLPKGLKLIATMRTESNVNAPSSGVEEVLIAHDSKENRRDIEEYLQKKIKLKGIQDYIKTKKTTEEYFIEQLQDKSEGNFIYLRHILHDIAIGRFKDSDPDSLPKGLQDYYEKHWQLMSQLDRAGWDEYKLPILAALTVAKSPISVDLISDFSKVKEKSKIYRVLGEWAEFLEAEPCIEKGDVKKSYRLYHSSFHDFIRKQAEVSGAHIDLGLTEKNIIDSFDWPTENEK